MSESTALLTLLADHPNGLSQSALQAKDPRLDPVTFQGLINTTLSARVEIWEKKLPGQEDPELWFTLKKKKEDKELSKEERFVLQRISEAGCKGVWTKDIKHSSGLQTQTLTRIYKSLESRNLIKPVKSYSQKSKKLYMLSSLEPSPSLTGGPWYTEHEFDHSFIQELRNFTLLYVRKNFSQNQRATTAKEVSEVVRQSGISRIDLKSNDVEQLLTTLRHDLHLTMTKEGGYVPRLPAPQKDHAERKKGQGFRFSFWGVLEEDFRWREMIWEGGGTVGREEPSHHSC